MTQDHSEGRQQANVGPAADPFELPESAYDIVVIGGGINGAGIARSLSRAGYRVLVLEKEDFGWGTTWRSTKLIHGGLRYLEHGEFGLVFESLRDQRALLDEYPDMVRPLSFLLPVYRGGRHRAMTIGLGLQMYDALSYGRSLPRHRRHSSRSAVAIESGLNPVGLSAAFTYSDCQAPFPERLCMQTLLEARDAGATLLNHAEVTRFLREGGQISGVVVRATGGISESQVRARLVINAAGPWVDEVLSGLEAGGSKQLGGTKGAHIVVDFQGRGPLHAVYAEARSDQRPFFILPWRNYHLIGTTDSRFEGSPDDATADEHDVAYLMNEANTLLSATPLERSQIMYAYAGVRPLPASDGVSEGAITRRHIIRDHAADGHAGLISIIGGKLSTYRSLASQLLDKAEQQVGAPLGKPVDKGAARSGMAKCQPELAFIGISRLLAPSLLDHLRSVYGPRLSCLLAVLAEMPALRRRLCENGPEIEAQVVYAARHEQARTLSDVLFRRTGVAWNRCLGLDCAPRAAKLIAQELHWSGERVAAEIARYMAEIERTFVVPGQAQRHPAHNG